MMHNDRRVQFSLRSLLAFVTLQCIVGAILINSRRSTAAITLPISSAVLVWCFVVAHRREPTTRRVGTIFVLAGWGLFLTSLFLPGTSIIQEPGEPPGTPAVVLAFILGMSFELACGLVLVLLKLLHAGAKSLSSLAPLWLLALPPINVAAVLSPVITRMRQGPRYMLLAAILSIVAPFFFPPELVGERYFGYYLWHASFAVTAVGAAVLWLQNRRARDAGGCGSQ